MMRGMIFGIALVACGVIAQAQELAGAPQVFDGKMLPRETVCRCARKLQLPPAAASSRQIPGALQPAPALVQLLRTRPTLYRKSFHASFALPIRAQDYFSTTRFDGPP